MVANVLATMVFFCALPAAAQRVSVADRVAILEQRTADANAASSRNNIEVLNQINGLRTEIGELRGQIEALQQQNEQLKSTLRSQSLDLDDRLQALERTATPAPEPVGVEDNNDRADPPPTTAPPKQARGAEVASTASVPAPPENASDAADPAPDPAEERAHYATAFDALKSGRYPEAKRLFQTFLNTFPEGVYAANAHYWLGESYYVSEDYANAQAQFETLIKRWPTHDKAAGALLKIGLSQYGQKQHEIAEATLNEVGQRYPGTDAAAIAADRLRSIQLSHLN